MCGDGDWVDDMVVIIIGCPSEADAAEVAADVAF